MSPPLRFGFLLTRMVEFRAPVVTLYSYCIPVDDGAAPNPFWGFCTLCICKPVIRRTAEEGDWIVGTGSRRSPIGDISGCVVYAMRVTRKLPMERYESFVRRHCPRKIPRWNARDHRDRLGDAIFDFRFKPPRIRVGVHTERNRTRDLSGKFVLISDHFFYFGDRPRPLPTILLPLAQNVQGHRSRSNDGLLQPFLAWIKELRLRPKELHGRPQCRLLESYEVSSCAQSGVC